MVKEVVNKEAMDEIEEQVEKKVQEILKQYEEKYVIEYGRMYERKVPAAGFWIFKRHRGNLLLELETETLIVVYSESAIDLAREIAGKIEAFAKEKNPAFEVTISKCFA